MFSLFELKGNHDNWVINFLKGSSYASNLISNDCIEDAGSSQ